MSDGNSWCTCRKKYGQSGGYDSSDCYVHGREVSLPHSDIKLYDEPPMSYVETLDFLLDQIDRELDDAEKACVKKLRKMAKKLDKLGDIDEWRRHANSPYT